jgi:hypothetical protein
VPGSHRSFWICTVTCVMPALPRGQKEGTRQQGSEEAEGSHVQKGRGEEGGETVGARLVRVQGQGRIVLVEWTELGGCVRFVPCL